MPVESFWDYSDAEKPTGNIDRDSTRKIPIDWRDWLTQEQTTYASHLLITATPLEIVSEAVLNGVVTFFVKVAALAEFTPGRRYPVTCRITCTDSQIEDRTVYFRVI